MLLARCKPVACCTADLTLRRRLTAGATAVSRLRVATDRRWQWAPVRRASSLSPALGAFDALAQKVAAPGFWEWMQSCALTDAFESALVFGSVTVVHSSLGLPWWASVAGLALTVRLGALPLRILSERLHAQRRRLETAVAQSAQNAARAQQSVHGWTDGHATQVAQGLGWWRLRRDRAPAARLTDTRLFVVSTLPTPAWLCSTLAVGNLCRPWRASYAPDLSSGGCAWFVDLLQPEPLPVKVLPLVTFLATYLQMRARASATTTLPRGAPLSAKVFEAYRNYFWIAMGLVILAVSQYIPVCLPFYWMVSMLLTLCFNLCLQHPNVKRLFGVVPAPTDSRKPLRRALAAAFLPRRFRSRLAL